MPDRHHETQSRAVLAGAAARPPEHRDAAPPVAGSHWVSARMSTHAEPLLPVPPPDNTDITARIEALRLMLAQAQGDAPAAVSNAETTQGAGGPPMPKFLRDQPPDVKGGWRAALQPKGPKDADAPTLKARPPADVAAPKDAARAPERRRGRAPWLIVTAATASIAALASLAYLNVPAALLKTPGPKLARVEPGLSVPSRPAAPKEEKNADQKAPPPPAVEVPPRSPASFVGTESCAGKPCEALGTYVSRAMAAQPVAAAESAAPGLMVSAAPTAIEAARPALDPLDTVTIRGLPPGARLSVGNRITDTEWALALGDLADVRIIVPHASADTVSATVEIRTREGEQLAQFGLTVERERPPPPPVTMSKDDDAKDESAGRPERQAKAPAKPAKAAKAKPQRAKAAQPAAPAAAAQAGTPKPPAVAKAAPPAVLFPLPAPKAVPAEPVEDEPGPPPVASSPVNRTPGFETLMSLGGGFALQEP